MHWHPESYCGAIILNLHLSAVSVHQGTKRYLRRLRPVCARNGARVEVEELGVVRLKKREGRDNGEKLPEDLGLRLEIKAKAAAFISNAQSAKGGEGLLGQILGVDLGL